MFAHISYTIFLQNTNFRTSDFKKFAQSLPIKIRHTKRKTFPQCSFDADPKFGLKGTMLCNKKLAYAQWAINYFLFINRTV